MALHPDYHHEAGKGSRPRPTNQEKYSSNYDLIWGKKPKKEEQNDQDKEKR